MVLFIMLPKVVLSFGSVMKSVVTSGQLEGGEGARWFYFLSLWMKYLSVTIEQYSHMKFSLKFDLD